MKVFTVTGALLALALPAQSAPAPLTSRKTRVKCAVRLISAAAGPAAVDRRLRFLRQKLRRPPLSRYRALALLDQQTASFDGPSEKELGLPDGRILALRFMELINDRRRRLRLRLHLSLRSPGAPPKPDRLFSIPDKGTYITPAGPARPEPDSAGGNQFVVVTCRKLR